MITVFKKWGFFCGLILLAFAQSVVAENLRILGEDKSFVTTLLSGESVTITRQMTPCAKNKGWLQPLVPEPGIVPVTEIEVLNAIGDPNIILVDMRTEEWFLDATQRTVEIVAPAAGADLGEGGCGLHRLQRGLRRGGRVARGHLRVRRRRDVPPHAPHQD